MTNLTNVCGNWNGAPSDTSWISFCVAYFSDMVSVGLQLTQNMVTENMLILLSIVQICDRLLFEPPDYIQCAKEYGTPIGYCYAVFNEFNSSEYWDCFDLVQNHRIENQEKDLTKWKFFELFCDSKHTFCEEYFYIKSYVFSMETRYLITDYNVIYYLYILPALGSVVIFVNSFLIYVIHTKLSRNWNTVFQQTKAVFDILTVLPQISIMIYLVTLNKSFDFISYNMCILIILCNEILPPMFHAVSMFLMLGLSYQKYIIISFPFKVAEILKVKYALLYISVVTVVCFLVFTPFMVILWEFDSLEVQSKEDINGVITTMLMPYSHNDTKWLSDMQTTGDILRNILLMAVPCFILLLSETMLIRRTMLYFDPSAHIKQVKHLTQLVYMTFASLGIFLVAEIPNAVMGTFLSVSTVMPNGSQTAREQAENIYYILNILTLISYLSNTLTSCLINSQFRQNCRQIFRCDNTK